jgi:hypothetical protein
VQIERKESKWIQAITGRHKKSRKPEIKHAQLVLLSVNQHELLNNLKELTNVTQNWGQKSSKGIEDRRRGNLVRRKHKVIITGDSYVTGCVAEVTHNLGETFEVMGYEKPGTRLEVITDTASIEIDKLMREDIVFVWGGANDIRKNASTDGLKHISNFVEHRRHTNTVIMNSPQKYDLITSSCVNSKVKAFNRKLCNRMKRFDHIEIIDVDLNTEHFTQHGLHTNMAGKELITQRTAKNIIRTLTRRMTSQQLEMEGRPYRK